MKKERTIDQVIEGGKKAEIQACIHRLKKAEREYKKAGLEKRLLRQLKNARLGEGLTQSEVSARLGVSQNSQMRFEKGIYHPTLKKVEEVANALGYRIQISLEKKEE